MMNDSVLEQIKARLTLSEFISKSVPLKKRGHEFVGCCPFHQEKTASFTVNDSKGFYHCFGCGVHGSIFDFLMFQQHIDFGEALRQAAQIAGVELPKFTKEPESVLSGREALLKILEEAAQYFQKQLNLAEGTEARDYLHHNRQLTPQVIKSFRIGYAPSQGSPLKEHLLKEGFALPLIQEAGLLSTTDRGDSYDKFRNRIMFPILDRASKVIGFGGRILGPGEPKYLNSPETPVFDKGRTLFNIDKAFKSLQRDQPVFVVEGYMDVIRLVQHGYERVVAPMGTALTEDQIQLLWKVYPEPLVCFDGDNAGHKAAERAAEKVLPLLKAGHSLNFIMLPDGEDPDTLLQRKGKTAWTQATTAATPLNEFLWQSLVTDFPKKTPEKKALLQKRIDQALQKITDSQVRTFYSYDLKDKFFAWSRELKKNKLSSSPTHSLTKLNSKALQERIIMACILQHPDLLDHVHEEFGCIVFDDKNYTILQQIILFYFHEQKPLEISSLHLYLTERKLDALCEQVRSVDLKVHAPFIWQSNKDELLDFWKATLSAYQTKQQDTLDLEQAKENLTQDFSQESWNRFKILKEMRYALPEDEKDELI
ncbi:MAG: DNA primase [Alphaproteobacteria bacterium]